MNAFGQNIDTAVNAFGIDFNSANNAFGLNGFVAPAPSQPVLLADYDFNFYTANDGTIENRAMTDIQPAVILEPAANTFDETDPSNKFLTIYAPDIAPDPTGGIQVPSMTFQSIEMWINLRDNESYTQTFLDFANVPFGQWLTDAEDISIGAAHQNAEYYLDAQFITLVSNEAPNIGNDIAGKGWYQVVVSYPAPITAEPYVFVSSSGNFGMPMSIGEIAFYSRQLTLEEIQLLYTSKIGRYE